MKQTMKVLAFAATAAMLLMGCVREEFEEEGRHAVRFGARAEMSQITRTTYSGIRDVSNMERINWDTGDKIRIYCNEATEPADKYADYVLTRKDPDGSKYDYASADPSKEDGHGLMWADGTNTFYSVFPAPKTSSVLSGDPNLSYASSHGIVEAILEADQSVTSTKQTEEDPPVSYYGNMDLAYMTASVAGTEGDNVILSFTPIVTTFYVTITNDTGNVMHLQRVALSSTHSALTGSWQTRFTTNLADREYWYYVGENLSSAPQHSAENSIIYSTFNDLEITQGACVTVALFALPHNITNLSLIVTSDESGDVTLPLKYNGEPLEFIGGWKHNISNLNVPGASYTLTRDKDVLTYDYSGVSSSAQEFTVTHTKTVGTNNFPAAWKTQIWSDTDEDGVQDEEEWLDLEGNCPAWLENFPLNSTGKTTAQSNISDTPALAHTYQKDVVAQEPVSHEQRLREGKVYDATGAVYDNSIKANALDLSKYNFITRRQEPNYGNSVARTTANCYVVSAPGWYKIPMVYGNLIEGGQTIANACKGARWALGHMDYFKKATDANIYLGINYPWLQHAYLDHCGVYWEKYTHWNESTQTAETPYWKVTSSSTSSGFGVIPNVELNLSEEYMYFEVSSDNIRPGNVLLATYGSDGDCCWSWHIWITDQNMNLITVDGNQVLPVNVGWVDDTKGQYYQERSRVLRFKSTDIDDMATEPMTVIQPEEERVSTSGWQTYYQWGRKDPLSRLITDVYEDDGTVNTSILYPAEIMYDESNFTFGTGLGNGSEYYDWTSANYNNLWDSQNTSWDTPSSSLPNHKTVYDPSPRGFSVPPDNAWDNLETYGYTGFDNGLHFYTSSSHESTIFFPASGFIEFNNARVEDKGIGGFYWTIRPGQNVQRRASYSFRFYEDLAHNISILAKSHAAGGEGSPFKTQAFRAYAYSVRPVLFNASAAPSEEIEGAVMEEIIFADEAEDWGWSNGENLSSGVTKTKGDVSVYIVRNYNLIGNDPTYTDGSVTIYRRNDLKVSVPSGHNIIQINLYYAADDQNLTVTPSPSSANWSDGNANKDAIWRIESYSGGVFTPSTNEVTFSFTDAFSSNSRKIYGLSVIYK